jgi:hypothetical protein
MLRVPSKQVISLILLGWALGYLSFFLLNAGKSIQKTTVSIAPLQHNTSQVQEEQRNLQEDEVDSQQEVEGDSQEVDIDSPLVETIQTPTIVPGSTTVVGVWFQLEKSKHGNNAYVEWSKKYFALECDMVIWYARSF